MASAAELQPVVSWNFDRLENGITVSSDGKYQAKVIRSEHVATVPGKLGHAVRIGGKYKGYVRLLIWPEGERRRLLTHDSHVR